VVATQDKAGRRKKVSHPAAVLPAIPQGVTSETYRVKGRSQIRLQPPQRTDAINLSHVKKGAAERMETEYTVNEQPICDMVQRTMQQEVPKLKPACLALLCKNSRSNQKDQAPKIKSNAVILTRMVKAKYNSAVKSIAQSKKSRSKLHQENHVLSFSDNHFPSVSRHQQ